MQTSFFLLINLQKNFIKLKDESTVQMLPFFKKPFQLWFLFLTVLLSPHWSLFPFLSFPFFSLFLPPPSPFVERTSSRFVIFERLRKEREREAFGRLYNETERKKKPLNQSSFWEKGEGWQRSLLKKKRKKSLFATSAINPLLCKIQ